MINLKLIYLFTQTFNIIIAVNANSSRFYIDESSEIKTAQIDLNDPNHQSLIQNNFNLSADEVRRIHMHSEQRARDSSIPNDENNRFKALKDDREEVIKTKIFDMRDKIASREELTHEMAAYPLCNQNNESQWLNENNVTVKFSKTFIERNDQHLYLDTAVLRLYKLNPNKTDSRTTRSTESNDCDDIPIDAQIRVTVSTIQTHRRNRKDRKKRICNTIMLNVSHHGWVEIDVKRAINIWEKFDRQKESNGNDSKPVMIGWLTIEVHDEEERPLKPGLYFEPPKCSQAYPALPWNAYRIYYSTPADMEKVPRSPRLDVKLIDLRGISAMLKRSNSALNFNALNQLNSQSSLTSSSSSSSSSSASASSSLSSLTSTTSFSSITSSDCNHTQTSRQHSNHNINDEHEFNYHNNNNVVNPEQTIYYSNQKLNATAKNRIDEILFSTVSAAFTPHHLSSSSSSYQNENLSISMSPPESSRRHIKRHIQQQEQIQQQQQLQQHQDNIRQYRQRNQQHNHNHHNHNGRLNGRRHLKQKQKHNQRFLNTNANKNEFDVVSDSTTSLVTSDNSNSNTNQESILIRNIRKLSK